MYLFIFIFSRTLHLSSCLLPRNLVIYVCIRVFVLPFILLSLHSICLSSASNTPSLLFAHFHQGKSSSATEPQRTAAPHQRNQALPRYLQVCLRCHRGRCRGHRWQSRGVHQAVRLDKKKCWCIRACWTSSPEGLFTNLQGFLLSLFMARWLFAVFCGHWIALSPPHHPRLLQSQSPPPPRPPPPCSRGHAILCYLFMCAASNEVIALFSLEVVV